jgi:hypothetical protein
MRLLKNEPVFLLKHSSQSRGFTDEWNSFPGCFVHKTPSLANDHKQAAIVVVGRFANAKRAENTTDFVLEPRAVEASGGWEVIKPFASWVR